MDLQAINVNWKKNDDFMATDKTYADQKLTDWIANQIQPFNVVEHEDFKEFCSAL